MIAAIVALGRINVSNFEGGPGAGLVGMMRLVYKKPRPMSSMIEIFLDLFICKFQKMVTGKTAKTKSVKADHAPEMKEISFRSSMS